MASEATGLEAWNVRISKELSTLNGMFTTLPDYISLDCVDHTPASSTSSGTCVLLFKIYPLVTKSLVVKIDVSARLPPAASYPLSPPSLSLVSGAAILPPGSDVPDGAPLHLSLEWTPSLTASDAILDIALRMRECVRNAEPFLNSVSVAVPASSSVSPKSMSVGVGVGNASRAGPPVVKAAVAVLDPKSGAAVLPPVPASAPAPAPGGPIGSLSSLLSRPGRRPSITLSVGDVQDLSAWDVVVYEAKSIRRPAFLTKRDADAAAARAASEAAVEKAKGGGVMGATGSFFKSAFSTVAGAGRSIIEETFIGVTSTQIVEIKASKFALNSGTVTTALPINGLAKLKFRRDESISFYFKEDANDPLVYMCAASAAVVEKVQSIMSAAGVKGRHTSSKQSRAIDDAIDLITLIQVKEQHLSKKPNVKLVREIMELYRLSTEKFAEAEDPRHEQVLDHMRFFLSRPLVKSLLDGTHVAKKAAESGKEGESGFSDEEGDGEDVDEEEEARGGGDPPAPIRRETAEEPNSADKSDSGRLQKLQDDEVKRKESQRKAAEEEARKKAFAEEEQQRVDAERAEVARLEALRKEEEVRQRALAEVERQRVIAEKAEVERLEALRIEEEARQKALLEEEERKRVAAEKAEAARLEALRKDEEAATQKALAEQAEAARLAEIQLMKQKEEEEERERSRIAALKAAAEEHERALAEERRQRLLEEEAAVERLAGLRRQEEESVAKLAERRKAEEAELERLAAMRKVEEDRIREKEEEAKRAAEERERAEEQQRVDEAEVARLEAIRLLAVQAEEEAERQRVPPPKGEVLERSYDDGASSEEDNDDDLDESSLIDLQNLNDYSLDSQNTSGHSISPGRKLKRMSFGFVEAIDAADQILREISAGENDLGELLGDAAAFAKWDRAGVTAETDDSDVVADLDRMLQEANSELESLGAH